MTHGRLAWLSPLLALGSLLTPATAFADDCGVELVEALRSKYALREMNADTSLVRRALCHEESSSGGSSGGFSLEIPLDVPIGVGMSQEELHRRRVKMCSDDLLWSNDERVREVAESLLDDNALEAYKTCKSAPGLQCSSVRESDVSVVFTAKWIPFAQLSDATQTHDLMAQNLTCRHSSMQAGHLFLGNSPTVAVCEILDAKLPGSLVIPTNRGDFVCSVKPRPKAETFASLIDSCRQGRKGACDEVVLRTHEAAKRCQRSAEPNIPAGATPKLRAQLQQTADLKTRNCVDLVGQMTAFSSLVKRRRAGCPAAECAHLDEMISQITLFVSVQIGQFDLSR